jgi:hypothetical protein
LSFEFLKASGEPLGDRVYDAVVESPLRHIEAKAWSRETFKTRLRQSMEGRETRGNGPEDLPDYKPPGQLYKDIVHFTTNGFQGVQWRFSKELAGAENEIKAEILKLVKENQNKLMAALNHESLDQWDDFMSALKPALDEFVTVIQ